MFMSKKHAKSAWAAKSSAEEMPWGSEIRWSGFNGLHGKIIYFDKGKRTSYKYNQLKNESLFVLSGKVRFSFGNEFHLEYPEDNPMEKVIGEPGAVLHVQSGCPYRVTALEDSVIIEIGNHLNSPVVRLEDDYDRIDDKNVRDQDGKFTDD
jgi:quercetin dioxygenase-like cupin family protein